MATDDLKNVQISVLKHFDTNLGSVSDVDYPGVGLDTKDLTEWFQVTLLGPIAAATRLGERYDRYVLNCNCFARVGRDAAGSQRETIHRHSELAGEFRAAFHQSDVPVKDWDAMGDPTIGYLRFEEVSVTPIHDMRETSLQQAAASVDGVLIMEG